MSARVPNLERRFRRALLVAAALALVSSSAATDDVSAPVEIAAYEGVWLRTAREENDAARAAEIERATADMPFWMRGLARSLLRSSTTPTERYSIHVADSRLVIRYDDAPRYFAIGDHAPGDNDAARMRIYDGHLEHDWNHGEDSHGVTVWTLTDARELVVTVTAYDKRLRGADGEPRAIRYATNYSRAPDANISSRFE